MNTIFKVLNEIEWIDVYNTHIDYDYDINEPGLPITAPYVNREAVLNYRFSAISLKNKMVILLETSDYNAKSSFYKFVISGLTNISVKEITDSLCYDVSICYNEKNVNLRFNDKLSAELFAKEFQEENCLYL